MRQEMPEKARISLLSQIYLLQIRERDTACCCFLAFASFIAIFELHPLFQRRSIKSGHEPAYLSETPEMMRQVGKPGEKRINSDTMGRDRVLRVCR
jgi:hypothetical protein